jgi:hypothetical protein
MGAYVGCDLNVLRMRSILERSRSSNDLEWWESDCICGRHRAYIWEMSHMSH